MHPIVAYFYEVGPSFGDKVLPWAEIDAWARRSASNPSPFICSLLRDMSVEYLAMANKAKESSCPNPTKPETAPVGRAKPEEEEERAEQPKQHRRLGRKR